MADLIDIPSIRTDSDNIKPDGTFMFFLFQISGGCDGKIFHFLIIDKINRIPKSIVFSVFDLDKNKYPPDLADQIDLESAPAPVGINDLKAFGRYKPCGDSLSFVTCGSVCLFCL